MSGKRIVTIRSGNEEVRMEVTEEEYQRYFRPWWRQKKREQRNREAMEEKGYTEESYEAWRDAAAEDMGVADTGQPDMDELLEKEMLLGVLEEALDSLMPEERELALKVFGEQVPVSEFAKQRGGSPGQRCLPGRFRCWGSCGRISGGRGWMCDYAWGFDKRGASLSNGFFKSF